MSWICRVKGRRWAVVSFEINILEEVEELVDVGLDPQLAAVPGGKGDPRAQIFNLEPVFYVDGQQNIHERN